jgi:UDP-glucuronate decarboxylase
MTKRVLVTGAAGFLGQACLPYLLEAGYTVHAISRKQISAASGEIVWHAVDLMDTSATASLLSQTRPSHLLHLAWVTEHGYYWHAPENLDWVMASLNLFRAFVRCGGQRALVTGTCAEYEWKNGICAEETTPVLPATHYGAAKKALFELLEHYKDTLDFSLVWGRLFFLYGPGENRSRLLPNVILGLLADKPVKTSHGRQQRDFLHVDDAARALVMLLNGSKQGAINVASGEMIPVRTVISTAAHLLGKPDLVQYGAIPLGETEPMLLGANVEKLRESGFTPRWSLKAGISDSIEYWRHRMRNQEAKGAAIC